MGLNKLTKNEIVTSITLYIIFLCVLIGTAVIRAFPGYMDESYYLIGARNLSEGYGYQEQILWNFMDDPDGLPHPSHLYWMPMVSILSASGLALFGNFYVAAVIPIAILVAFVAPLMYVVLKIWLKDQFWAVIGALFAIVGGYYLTYYSAVDSFGLYMILGFGYFAIVAKVYSQKTENLYIHGILIGILAGLMHLTRAEGLLWAGMIPIFFFFAGWRNRKKSKNSIKKWLVSGGLGLFVYILVMFPWFYRNIQLFGSLTAKGSSTNLFLTNYNDLFHYPISEVTLNRWLDIGLSALLKQRFDAIGVNLLSIVGVQMLIVQVPFVLVGIWKNRHSSWVKINLFGMAVIFMFFTLVFPLAGMRGSYFHTGTAFQIFIWSMAIYGLRHVISRLPLNVDVDRKKFERFFGIGFLSLIIFVSGFIFISKISTWNTGTSEVVDIGEHFDTIEVKHSEIILINDPATFHWITERPAIVIPGGDEEMMLLVMEKYGVNYAVIQVNHPPELNKLYQEPYQSHDFNVITKEGSWLILQKVQNE